MTAPQVARNAVIMVDTGSTAGTAPPVQLANANKITLNMARDKIDTTSFGDASKTKLVGLPDGTGTIGVFWSTDGTHYKVADGSPRKMYAYLGGTGASAEYFFGTFVFDTNIDADVNGVLTGSLSFDAATSLTRGQLA